MCLYTVNPYPANTTAPNFAISVDPDQVASEETIWSGSTLFVMQFVHYIKLSD